MMSFAFIPIVFGILQFALCAPPEVSCPVPLSPEHGQAFLYQEGQVVKYACEPGYVLKGKELVRCVDGQWEDPNPACLEIGADITENPEISISDTLAPIPPPARPLFNWGSAEDDENQEEINSTTEEMPLSDEARVRLVMYPQRRARIVTSHIRTGRLQSATELEEEEKKRSQDGKSETSTTIHLESPPPVMYVRRTLTPGKSEAQRRALDEQYKTAALHMSVENGHDVQVLLPRAAVTLDDKGQQAEQTLRQMYWYAHHNYPRQASLVEYRSGAPVVMTLTDSQLSWINSLHPELRDQYLRDVYVMRAEEAAEGERAQAFLRRYEDAYNYNYMYHLPYLRQPVSLVMEDPIANYDYTCHESGNPFVKAPRLRNMHIARYDRRQNPNNPHNNYLSAIYRCNPGYVMLDTRFTELHCSKKDWIGVRPVCARKG